MVLDRGTRVSLRSRSETRNYASAAGHEEREFVYVGILPTKSHVKVVLRARAVIQFPIPLDDVNQPPTSD